MKPSIGTHILYKVRQLGAAASLTGEALAIRSPAGGGGPNQTNHSAPGSSEFNKQKTTKARAEIAAGAPTRARAEKEGGAGRTARPNPGSVSEAIGTNVLPSWGHGGKKHPVVAVEPRQERLEHCAMVAALNLIARRCAPPLPSSGGSLHPLFSGMPRFLFQPLALEGGQRWETAAAGSAGRSLAAPQTALHSTGLAQTG